jgi:hypothetical protein
MAEYYLWTVKRNGMKLYFVPIKYQTMEVCTAAVERRLKEGWVKK